MTPGQRAKRSWWTMVQMILSSSWNISLEHTNNIMLFVIILLFPKSVLPFHPISCGNFRNGVNTELAKEEFVALKMLISRMFKDKSYTSLWEMMLNREPYCSEFKVFILFLFQRASLHSDTVEVLIRISVEGPTLEDFEPKESLAIWLTQGRRATRPHYKCWPCDHGPADPQWSSQGTPHTCVYVFFCLVYLFELFKHFRTGTLNFFYYPSCC